MPKRHRIQRADGRSVPVSVPPDPKPEELLDDVLRENLSPEAIAAIAAHLQNAGSNDEQADRQVCWFAERLMGLLGFDQYRRLKEQLGL